MFSFRKEKINTNPEKIEEILSRGTEDVFVKEHLKEVLFSGKQLRVKLGIDPTSPDIHLGRAVVLRKLKAFQDLGHKVVLIIGDFTAKIGDPSDKLEKRPMLTDEDIKKNLKGYLKQIGKIIDLKKTEIRYNSEWLKSMDYLETAKLLECFTVQQMSKRRNFHDRLEQGQDIFVVEFMYPALQGYDSVKVDADVELGGFDQLFNLKAGRIVQKRYGKKEQDIMTVSMLPGTDGRKMSSSWGNVISLRDTNEDMFGKIMAVRDDLIIQYFKLCTDIPLQDIRGFEEEMKLGVNPKSIKMRLAYEIVKMYHGEKFAKSAQDNFENTFAKGGVPEDVVGVAVAGGTKLVDILMVQKIVISKSEWRRLVSEGAVTNMDGDIKIDNPDTEVSSGVYKIGKRRFIKIKVI
ncbi:MAG: tyrosine--tRNA ligase [Parcubacteria bacterium C7867-006]|nr:MAG: tyrosine--tRNA ligase [Parcubacteria bacterium C7867-006]